MDIVERYQSFLGRIGWCQEVVDGRCFIEFPCGSSECPPLHTLWLFIDEFATDKAEAEKRVYQLGEKLHRSPWDTPNITVVGENPSVSFFSMVHGHGGGNYSIPHWAPNWEEHWEASLKKV
jgi:hypothetical protein